MNTDFPKKYGMFNAGDRILCAVSGGADSMCLLHWLNKNAELLGIEVFAAHFDHCLRGEESTRDRLFVEAYCRENGIECAVGSADVKAFAEENGMGTEDAARKLRYDFLYAAAEKLDCNKIATAHNSDDNAETVILNLTRGTGAKGLCGIPPVRDMLIRPLLGTDRSEIEKYDAENSVPFVTDSTNLSDDYTRNVVRHKIMPVLRQINPAFSESFLRTSELLREDEEYLGRQAQDFVSEYFEDKSLPADKLIALPKPLASRVLRIVCGRTLTNKQTEAVFGILGRTGLAHCDVSGMRITADSGRLYFGKSSASFEDAVITVGKTLDISDGLFSVKAEMLSHDAEVFKSFNKLYFNYDSICGTIRFTTRRAGDKVRLAGRNCTKSLKDLFCEKGIPQYERDLTPVIRDDMGIIAVFGFGVAERCRVSPDGKILCISINYN